MEGKSASPDFIGIQDEKIFVLKSANAKNAGSYYIDVYNETSLEEDQKIDLKKMLPKDIADNELYDVYLMNGKIIIVTLDKKKEMYATSIDLKGKILKAKVVLDRVEGRDKDFEGFTVALSPDKTKLLGFRKAKGKVKKTTAYNFALYDDELKKIVSSKQELPYEEDNFSLLDVKVDNKGDVFCVAKITIEGKRKKFNTQKAVLMNLDLSQAKPEMNEVNLPFEKRIASSLSFLLSDDKIIVTGMYATNKDAEQLEGIFYIELNKKNFEVIRSNYEKFKSGLQTRVQASKKMENNVGFGYRLRSIHTNEKNEKLMVFENKEVTFISSKSGTAKVTVSTDIIAVKLNADNKLVWNTLINKNQALRVPVTNVVGVGMIAVEINVYRFYKKMEDLLSYTLLYKGDKMYFVFNDHNKNMKTKTTDKVFNNFKKSYSALVTLNTDNGKWDKKAIFTKQEAQRIITPNNSVQISDNKILTFSFTKKASSIGYLTID